MAFVQLQLNTLLFYTERNQGTYQVQTGIFRPKERVWTFNVVLEDDGDRSNLIALFSGALVPVLYQPIPATLPDGLVVNVLLTPTTLPLQEYPYSVPVTLTECFA
jgi:hypothetical protein